MPDTVPATSVFSDATCTTQIEVVFVAARACGAPPRHTVLDGTVYEVGAVAGTLYQPALESGSPCRSVVLASGTTAHLLGRPIELGTVSRAVLR
jgi:hypothetical protein